MLFGPAFQVQFAQVDITPPELLPLGGYTARGSKKMEPGGEPLYAKVVRMKMGNQTVALVSVDMLTVPESLVREVRARIPKTDKLFLAATHTHSAPDSQMLNDRMTFAIPGIAKFEPKWLTWYADKISAGINGAEAATPISDSTLLVSFAQIDANRGRRAGAIPDKQATSIGIINRAGRPIRNELFFHYAAHAVFHGSENLKTSPDWPGRTAHLDRCAVLAGAIGDVSPVGEGTDSETRIRDFWTRMSGQSGSDKWKLRTLPIDRFTSISEPIALDPIKPHPAFAKDNKIPQAFADQIVSRFAPPTAEITAFRIGKLCVIGVPGEPTSALGKRIRDAGRNIGFEFVLVCSHVNGWIGYILEAEDYARGGYEGSLAFHGPGTAQKVFEASVRAMNSLAFPNRTKPNPAPSAKITNL